MEGVLGNEPTRFGRGHRLEIDMSFEMFKRTAALLLVLLQIPSTAWAGPEEAPSSTEKTLSPYFFVKTDVENGEVLPLRSTEAQVSIVGVIADVKVTQVYQNRGKAPIEAVYVFPGSTRAAVYGMKMTIGDRVREAKIKERSQAKQEYKEAKKAGKSASLLEQHRPNVFQMNVANILPGDEIKVELSYTEMLVPTDGIYDFVYPTVVGPRYSNRPEKGASETDQFVQNPFLHQGESPTYDFDIVVRMQSGLNIQELLSTSHEIDVKYNDAANALVTLKPAERQGGNRDYILKYRLQGGAIESGLMLYQGQEENFFLLMVQPPDRVQAEEIPSREYIFVVDVSGSMHGFPIETSKKVLRELIGNLKSTDTFNVILFAGVSALFSSESVAADSANITNALAFIEKEQGSGGTELLPALKRALMLPRAENVSRSIVIATDGYIDVEEDAFELIRSNLNQANVFTFGIGAGVNRHLLEGMARVGRGEPFIVTRSEEAQRMAILFREYIETPVLTQVKVDFGEFEVSDVEPRTIPDVLAKRPVLVFGKWKGEARGKIKLNGITGGEPYTAEIDAAGVQPREANSALRYLWARDRIATAGDFNSLKNGDVRIEEITKLGIKYNLLTAYTSFIAVDDQVRNPAGDSTLIKQPLPLPQGVADSAVGGLIPTVPEPETYLMLLLLGGILTAVGISRRDEYRRWLASERR